MKKLILAVTVLATAAALQGCGQSSSDAPEAVAAVPAESTTANPSNGAETMPGMASAAAADGPFQANGEITAVSGDQVTIAHGPVAGLGWPAMTMAFTAPDPQQAAALSAGDPVAFAFRKEGNRYVLTQIDRR